MQEQSPQRARVKDLFVRAVGKTGSQREVFLDKACRGDAALRQEVEAFLSAAERAGDFLDSPTVDAKVLDVTVASAPAEGPGSVIGRYKLLQLIGEGGFGSVFMAEQEVPVHRRVALKIIKLGMDTSQVIARFEAERQALAMMEHPNIARVLDAGATETGRPYFVMELVKGVPITQYCDANRLPTAHRLALFTAVCQALQHAHQKGVIHRDIKPSNILVTLHDGVPVPKVIDFGIAKATNSRLTERTLFTEFRQMVGTPAYMSPEQAEMSGLDIDTRSDIYALGVLLYELLTGTTPFDPKALTSAAYGEMQRIIREVDPPRPSTRISTLGQTLSTVAANRSAEPGKLGQLVRGDLDWIVMKALEKDRSRRYETATEFARDVERHLKHEVVEARPPSAAYRLRKFARRNRATLVTLGAFAAVIAIAIGLYIHAIRREQGKTSAALVETQGQRVEADRRRVEAQQATTRALAAQAEANDKFVAAAISQARAGVASTRAGRRFDSLKALAAAARISPTTVVRSQAIQCMALADLCVTREWRSDRALDFNHSCTMYLDCDASGDEVRLHQVPAAGAAPGPPILRLRGRLWNYRACFSPDDRYLALSHADGHVRVFKLDGSLVLEAEGGPGCDFTPDSEAIIIGTTEGSVSVRDLVSGKVRLRLTGSASDAICLSPDGRMLAMWSIYRSPDVSLLDLGSGRLSQPIHHSALVLRVAWHPGAATLATAMQGGTINLWNVAAIDDIRPGPVPEILGHQATAFDVAFNRGGELLASSSWDGTMRLWDSVSGRELVQIFAEGILRFGSDDRQVAVSGETGIHTMADVAIGNECRTLRRPPMQRGSDVAFSPDGLVMAYGGADRVRFWNMTGESPGRRYLDVAMPRPVRFAEFEPEGHSLIAGTDGGLWRIPAGKALASRFKADGPESWLVRLGPVEAPVLTYPERGGDGAVRISVDGRRLAVGQYAHDAFVMDPREPGKRIVLAGTSDTGLLDMSSDQKWLVTGTWKGSGDHRVRIWDARTGKPVHALPVALDASVAFSPDNHWLVTSTPDETRFWEVGSWTARHSIARTAASRYGTVVFSRDSRMLAISLRHMGVTLVEPNTGRELATLDEEGREYAVGFSPDGGLLVTFGENDTLRLWDLRRIRAQLGEMGLDWPGPALPPRHKDVVELQPGSDALLRAVQGAIERITPTTNRAAP
jgi:WD40 repeat protein